MRRVVFFLVMLAPLLFCETGPWALAADRADAPGAMLEDGAEQESFALQPPGEEPRAPFADVPTRDEGYTGADKIELFMSETPESSSEVAPGVARGVAPESAYGPVSGQTSGQAAIQNSGPATGQNATLGMPQMPAPTAVLTLEKACRLAVQNHPRIDSAIADYNEAAADYGMARSVYYPSVDWSTKVGPSTELDTEKTEQGDTALSITQKLIHFGGIDSAVDSAKLRFEGAGKQHQRTCEDIAVLAINAYLAVLQSEELVRVRQGALAFYEKLLSSFQERYMAGISSKADAKKVEVSLRDAQAQLVTQNEQLSTSRSLLENIIYEPVGDLEPNVDLLRVSISGSLEDAYKRALETNMNLQAVKLQVKSQQKSIESSKADYFPTIGYRMQLKNEFQTMKSPDVFTRTADVQLTFDWNLFNGFSTDHEILKKKAALRRLKASQRSMELEVKNVLTNALNSYKASAEEHKLAKEAFDSSVSLMSLYLSEFDLGIRTLLDLTAAREGQTSAAVREVNARFTRIRAAVNILLEEGRLASTLKLSLQK